MTRHDGRRAPSALVDARRASFRHRAVRLLALSGALAGMAVAIVAPGRAGAARNRATRSPYAPVVVGDNHWHDAINPTAVPLGDGKVSTSARVGYVDSCTTSFRGGGAAHSGPWINAAGGTWDKRTKLAVQGRHRWSTASFHFSVHGTKRVLSTNDLPKGKLTGTFPISPSDPAYSIDRNPNSIGTQHLTFDVPRHPKWATRPSCTTLGPIGVMDDGVLLFNALDAAGRDAGAHEVQDLCQGHPNGQDEYHYHSVSSCILTPKRNSSQLVGYALDGYGIYAEWNGNGKLPTNANLDACHGRKSTVLWHGKKVRIYHYDATLEYPYTVGCFRGTPTRTRPQGQRPPG